MRIAVVGAGMSGLGAARDLSASNAVTVIDRLPVTGGMTGWEDVEIARLTSECTRGGVVYALGATALRWTGGRLLVAAPEGMRWMEFDHLVYAGGWRPSTRAELGIAGSRPAGVFPALVAKHLLEAGACLGRRIMIVGATSWSRLVADEVHREAHQVVVVDRAGGSRPAYADEWWSGWEAVSIHGAARVEATSLRKGTEIVRTVCDAVVLAAEPQPLRNVDGAIGGGVSVTYAQPDPFARRSDRAAIVSRSIQSLVGSEHGVTS